MDRDFVASVYIFCEDKVLLLYHKKLHVWLPPGGHVEKNELPHEAALREVHEETGLQVELCSEENIFVDEWNAKSIPRPYLMLLEEIPEWKNTPKHQHIDSVFIAKLSPLQAHKALSTEEEIRWFTSEEVTALKEEDMFPETKKVLFHLFEKFSLISAL